LDTNEATMQQRLVSCEWLAQRLDDPQVRVVEVSSNPDGAAYHQRHIPGAAFWFWKEALWHASDREFATPQEMARRLGAMGISSETTVVIYGDPIQYGTYAIWVLVMAGHRDVRLLDGGRKLWVAEGRPVTAEIPRFEASEYSPGPADQSSRVGRDNVCAKLGTPERVLLDVRSPEEYTGKRVSPPTMGLDHGAERTGRIPGAVHLYYQELLNDDDTFLSADQLQAKLSGAGVTGESGREIVAYCRLSHRATLAWFAMNYLLGMDDVKIYDGSWTEWGSIVGFPVETD
jgi:thiosulfate/3-mercaptopyruvate sulfurtransferase